jgi:hypothetical protein
MRSTVFANGKAMRVRLHPITGMVERCALHITIGTYPGANDLDIHMDVDQMKELVTELVKAAMAFKPDPLEIDGE